MAVLNTVHAPVDILIWAFNEIITVASADESFSIAALTSLCQVSKALRISACAPPEAYTVALRLDPAEAIVSTDPLDVTCAAKTVTPLTFCVSVGPSLLWKTLL